MSLTHQGRREVLVCSVRDSVRLPSHYAEGADVREDRPLLIDSELEPCGNSKVPTSSLDGPEQISALVIRHAHNLAPGQYQTSGQ